eukprot:130443-Amphidinium_carterae.1
MQCLLAHVRIVRLFSMLHACALAELESINAGTEQIEEVDGTQKLSYTLSKIAVNLADVCLQRLSAVCRWPLIATKPVCKSCGRHASRRSFHDAQKEMKDFDSGFTE